MWRRGAPTCPKPPSTDFKGMPPPPLMTSPTPCTPGITEDVASWRTDVVLQMVDALGAERLMFEAADPQVFSW